MGPATGHKAREALLKWYSNVIEPTAVSSRGSVAKCLASWVCHVAGSFQSLDEVCLPSLM